MTLIDGLIIFFAILLVYFFIVFILKKNGFLERHHISLSGPFLLIRTTKFKNLLDKIAKRKRFWKSYGSFGVFLCLLIMITFVILIIFNFSIIFQLTPEQKAVLPGPETALVLPGINPILPVEYLFYILLAFLIAIVVHEFSHGILAIVSKIKVKSVGLLCFIFPIGAFCEPDEDQLKKADTVKRMRVFAAGPLSNFVVAFVCILLFSYVFMGAVQQVDGADILYVVPGSPAEEIGITSGAVVTNVNDTEIIGINDFSIAMANISPNQEVNITYYFAEEFVTKKAKLASLSEFSGNDSHKNTSFLGVSFNLYTNLLNYLKNPLTSDLFGSFIVLYSFPFIAYQYGYNPIAEPFINGYQITGPLSALPSSVFWGFVNALFWIFWLNLLVGIFNSLPILPLDGGHLFKDSLDIIVRKIKKDISDEKREALVKNISLIVSLLILFLVIFPFFIGYF